LNDMLKVIYQYRWNYLIQINTTLNIEIFKKNCGTTFTFDGITFTVQSMYRSLINNENLPVKIKIFMWVAVNVDFYLIKIELLTVLCSFLSEAQVFDIILLLRHFNKFQDILISCIF
ncbi:hypothetical protein ACJX0J_010256, partial [Zea mays]